MGLLAADLKPHCSGKVAVVGHTPHKNGEVLNLGYLKCIDTSATAGCGLEVRTGKVWQANMTGEMRNK